MRRLKFAYLVTTKNNPVWYLGWFGEEPAVFCHFRARKEICYRHESIQHRRPTVCRLCANNQKYQGHKQNLYPQGAQSRVRVRHIDIYYNIMQSHLGCACTNRDEAMTQVDRGTRSVGRCKNGLRQYLSCKKPQKSAGWSRQDGNPSYLPGDEGDSRTGKNMLLPGSCR